MIKFLVTLNGDEFIGEVRKGFGSYTLTNPLVLLSTEGTLSLTDPLLLSDEKEISLPYSQVIYSYVPVPEVIDYYKSAYKYYRSDLSRLDKKKQMSDAHSRMLGLENSKSNGRFS